MYALQKFDLAVKRFDHALQVLKTFRGDQTSEQTEALNMLHITLLGNSAAALMAKEVLFPRPRVPLPEPEKQTTDALRHRIVRIVLHL